MSSFKVGYVLKRFPRLTETFILNEVLELERQGVPVEIFSLKPPTDEPRHALLDDLKAPVTYLPDRKMLLGLGAGGLSRDQHGKLRPETPIVDLLEPEEPVYPELMPGKSAADAALLTAKAMTIALLAQTRGVSHLHAHFGSDATTAALLAGRLACLPYSYTAHARDIYHAYVDPEADALMRRAKIAEAEFVVTVSDYNAEYLRNLAGPASARKIHRLYNGIDLNRFHPANAGQQNGRTVLAVGRLVEKKGFGDLIEACRRLHDRGQFDFDVQIVGEGPLHAALADQIASAGFGDRVQLLGALPQQRVISLMQRAATLILPCVVAKSGDRDGLPTVLLEAMALGVPPISTRTAGVPEIIDHQRNGLLVEPNNPAGLAEALAAMIDDPAMRTKMATAARSKAETTFDLATNVGQLRRYFEQSVQRAINFEQGAGNAHRISVA